MEQIVTFGGITIDNVNPDHIQQLYSVKLNGTSDNEEIPTEFPNIIQSVCSCDKHVVELTMDVFKLVDATENSSCAICRYQENEPCIEHKSSESNTKCPIAQSVSCSHSFHACCISRWLHTKKTCPLCNIEWQLIGANSDSVVIYFDDKNQEFKLSDNLVEDIGRQFGIDMDNYIVCKNKSPVTEYKNSTYALCTRDRHNSQNGQSNLKIICEFDSKTENLFIKYSTTIEELRKLVSQTFDLFKDQVKLIYNNIEISKDFDNLTVFNIGIKNESNFTVECYKSFTYDMEITNNFMVLYVPDTFNTTNSSNNIQSVVSGSIAWIPQPFIDNVTNKDLRCLLSSLYILVKKVNLNTELIQSVTDRFEKYMELYGMHYRQIKLAKDSLRCLLEMNHFNNKDRMILSCIFYELIDRIQRDNNINKNPLLSSNLICNLILSDKQVNEQTKINWKFLAKDVRITKVFNIYSPLVLTNSVPPLLTLNKNLDVVVFTGKGKDVSLPIILYDTLTNSETDVNAAELGKIVSDKGDLMMVDDRIYEEAIMVCIDTSNSMSKASDFDEDIKLKRSSIIETKNRFYEILKTESHSSPQESDIRQLTNTIIWFITHPNFEDWYRKLYSQELIRSIACFEQKVYPNFAMMLVKYPGFFNKLLTSKKVVVNNTCYSFIRNESNSNYNETKYSKEPLQEFLCPISHEIMEHPVVAKDGFTYEKSNILKWFENKSTSPMTNEKISKKICDNKVLKSIIRDWKENNTVIEQSDKLSVTIKLPDPWNETVIHYNETDNIWDLIYQIYHITGLSHDQYKLTSNYWAIDKSSLIKQISSKIKIHPFEKKMVDVKICDKTYFFGTENTMTVSSFYTVGNLLYKLKSRKYHRYAVWYGLKDSGDGFQRGTILSPHDKLIDYSEMTLEIHSSNRYKTPKGNHLSRLDVVKKLFDAYINRSIAYSFNTAIGLMSFSDKSVLECAISPFYESFREKVNELDTSGATALYECLKDSIENLIEWKNADLENRSKAKLRIICLTDGKDTGLDKFKNTVKHKSQYHNVTIDCILIGSDYDNYLGKIGEKTNGYVFNPSTIKYALDIMELETMISSTNRKTIFYHNTIDEKTIPPIINPTKKLHAKAISPMEIISKTNENTKLSQKLIRVQREIVDVMKNQHPDIDVYINEQDISFWKIVFKGPDSTPYKNGTWLAYIQFTEEYPNIAPNIRFVTPIKHCNINNYGRVCHSILDRNYTPNVKISLILQCIYGLLLNPDVNDPLDTNLAMIYYDANGLYEAQIIDYVNKFALKSREEWNQELAKNQFKNW
ncbi:RING-finger-containing E3 ubiquitin ligase [Acanthamoeba polyphaga mimivirus]|nr:RING-finger-containing E3 ubiquitin ligase [Mimivirus reunion]WMV62178.1 RING-finger-containing E3 ubiquitin ligase [Mimivirus sp.]WMV63155.1 RING-finger-containing E3 ubiquitin ligase [Acanthamoeba polyphaga mimivirus]WMV64132.1 RING-finger-containing E3 ubiquitin ligase [Mimivirus sp.]